MFVYPEGKSSNSAHFFKMCEKNSDTMKKIPSEGSLAGMEKTGNDSSRLSGSPTQWDLEESCMTSDHLNSDGRMRQSSWDNSDNDLSPEHEKSPETGRLYSDDSTQFRGSITFEINELKKQFFETMEKMRDENDSEELENLKDKIESKLNSDRRQSPARMRRRTKSSSSSSPILESKSRNSPEKIETLNESEAIFEDISTKVLEFDQKFYLNNFFTEIRSRRISLMDFTSGTGSVQEPPDSEGECIQTSNEIISLDSNENDDYFCKTSRKLSKILEVEENKTDLEKSSEEKLDNSELFSKTLKNPEEKLISPLPTARSRKSEKVSKKEEKYKSLSCEEFGNYRRVEKPFQGSLSERSTKIISRKLNDNFISLAAKSEKTQMDLFSDTKLYLSPKEANKDFLAEPNFEAEEKEKKLGSQEFLNIDLMKGLICENFTPRKSTDRSEGTHTSRSMSAKSRRNANSDRQMLSINIGKDSDRSLRVEDINSPDSSRKNSKDKTHSELKTFSQDDCSPTSTKNNNFTNRTEEGSESKTNRNLQNIQSPNVESVKSSYRKSKEEDMNYLKSHRSFQTSHRKKKKQKQNDQNLDFETNESIPSFEIEKEESSSSMESNRSYGSSHNKSSRSGSLIKIINMDISNENQSSFWSLRSDERRDLKSEEDDELCDQGISKNDEILELGLPLEILGRPESRKESSRSAKTIELDAITKDSDTSETNMLKRTSRSAYERSLTSRSRNMESRRSTPRSLRITSRTNSGNSSRSKDSLGNRDDTGNSERLRSAAWKELEKICDIVQNQSSVSSASSRSSWRELETSDQQNSYRKKIFSSEADNSDVIIMHKNNDTSDEQLLRSRKNSRKFPDSQTAESLDNNNSDSSIKTTPRPTSWNSEEHKTTGIHCEVVKLNMDPVNEKSIDRLFKEDKDREKSSSTQNYESGTESDRNSNKRLSIINEVSFENLKNFSENEEGEISEHSGKYSRRSNRQLSPKNVKKTQNSSDDLPPKVDNPDDERWNELIEKFCPNQNSSCDLEDTFIRLSQKKGNSFDSARSATLEKNTANNDCFENQLDLSTLSKRSENEYGSLENIVLYEKIFEEKRAINLECKEPLLKKDLEEKNFHIVQNPQNLFYFNLSKEGHLGIGEFGDVTCWNTGKSDTIDSEKPKDHGDGAQTQKNLEVLILPEKTVNEMKTQRNLWTELRKDFRDSKPLLNKLFPEAEDYVDFTFPISLKTSKSDNCIKPKVNAGSDFETPPTCKFLSEYNGVPKKTENEFLELENSKKMNKEVKSMSESVTEKRLSLESLEFEIEDSENQEFECEITPRLSMSMSNFETQFQEDSFMSRESNELFSTSRTQLFEKVTDSGKYESEMTDLNIFLAPNEKKGKMIIKSNWLNIKNPGKEKSRDKNQKIKKKIKNKSSPKEPFHEYLYPRKRMSNVSQLKLGNSNCFQNFYKRFISVFCLTSHSSSATSK